MSDKFQYAYPLEKLALALYGLAVGQGNLTSRLQSAFLSMHTLSPNDFPEELRPDIVFVLDTLTSKEPRFQGDGKLQATLDQMDDATSRQIAEKTVDLFIHLKELEVAGR